MDFDNTNDTLTPDVASNTITFGGNGSIALPSGTQAQRPGSSLTPGMFRWVTNVGVGGITGAVEVYTDGTNTWKALQYTSANLDGLSGLSTNGIVVRTGGGGAFATRSITSNGSTIAVSNTNGGAGDINLDLPTTLTLPGQLNFNTIATVASAATTDIGAATSNMISVTGTTTITALGTIAAGAWRQVRFAGILTLTHNATSLILPTGANITTAAGDVAQFVSLGSGNWYCSAYSRANGQALSGGTGSAITTSDEGSTLTSSTTSFNFTGSGVTATNTGGAVTVTIPGATGGSTTFTANAAAALSAGNLVYITSSGTVDKADNSTEGKEAIGFILSGVSSGASATVYVHGNIITGLSSLTAGTYYYMGTSGALTQTPPSSQGNVVLKVGPAITSTSLLFVPQSPITL